MVTLVKLQCNLWARHEDETHKVKNFIKKQGEKTRWKKNKNKLTNVKLSKKQKQGKNIKKGENINNIPQQFLIIIIVKNILLTVTIMITMIITI